MARKKYFVKPGDVFGVWTVIEFLEGRRSNSGKKLYVWKCRCSCGAEKEVEQHSLIHARSQKCVKCANAGKGRTHGMSSERIYKTWQAMRYRCENPSNEEFHNYGGRGIKVCDRWQDFTLFYADMGDLPSKEHSIERIDVNGNYEPDNCTWATPKEQARNQRRTRMITHDGRTMCMSDWAEELGIKPVVLSARINTYGWSVEDALTMPVKRGLSYKMRTK